MARPEPSTASTATASTSAGKASCTSPRRMSSIVEAAAVVAGHQPQRHAERRRPPARRRSRPRARRARRTAGGSRRRGRACRCRAGGARSRRPATPAASAARAGRSARDRWAPASARQHGQQRGDRPRWPAPPRPARSRGDRALTRGPRTTRARGSSSPCSTSTIRLTATNRMAKTNDRGLDDREVAPGHGLHDEPAHPRPREDRLDHDGAAQHEAEREPADREEGAGRVAQGVAVDHPALGQPLGPRRADVVVLQHLQHPAADQAHVLGERRGGQRERGQDQVGERAPAEGRQKPAQRRRRRAG